MRRKELADFENWYVLWETDKAFLVCEEKMSAYAKGAKFWLPKSAMEYEKKDNDRIDFTIPQSMAEEKGMV